MPAMPDPWGIAGDQPDAAVPAGSAAAAGVDPWGVSEAAGGIDPGVAASLAAHEKEVVDKVARMKSESPTIAAGRYTDEDLRKIAESQLPLPEHQRVSGSEFGKAVLPTIKGGFQQMAGGALQREAEIYAADVNDPRTLQGNVAGIMRVLGGDKLVEESLKGAGVQSEEGARLARQGINLARTAIPEGKKLNIMQESALGAANSLAQMAPGTAASLALRNPAPLLAMMGLQTKAQTYATARNPVDGSTVQVSPRVADLVSTLDGFIEIGTELQPALRLFDGTPGLKARLIGVLAAEIPGEMVATTLQDLDAKLSYNPNMTWADFIHDLQVTVLSTAMSAPVQAGAAHGLHTIARRVAGQPGRTPIPEPGQPAAPGGGQEQAAAPNVGREPVDALFDAAGNPIQDTGTAPSVPDVTIPPEIAAQAAAEASIPVGMGEATPPAAAIEGAGLPLATPGVNTPGYAGVSTPGVNTIGKVEGISPEIAKAAEAPQVSTEPAGKDYFDPRMKRAAFRDAMQASVGQDMTPGGGIAVVPDLEAGARRGESEAKLGPMDGGYPQKRSSSVHAPWVQDLLAETGMSVNEVRTAVDKAVQKKPLGIRQARAVGRVLDNITGERQGRPSLDYARQQLEDARMVRRQLNAQLASQEEVERLADGAPEISQAGALYPEHEYRHEQDAISRMMTEIADESRALGESPDNLEKILSSQQDDKTVLRNLIVNLERLKRGQEKTPERVAPGDHTAAAGKRPEGLPAGTPAGSTEEAAKAQNTQQEVALAIAERRADAGSRQERRTDSAARARVADMSTPELRAALLTDPLTGLPNRRAYEESERLPVQVSIDLDMFKAINDTLGHEAGDEVLRAAGEVLGQKSVRAYRRAGDEFIVEAHTQAEADAIMADFRETMRKAKIEITTPDGRKITHDGVGVSYGTGKTFAEADANLRADKVRRKSAGLRQDRAQMAGQRAKGKQSQDNNTEKGQVDHGQEIAREKLDAGIQSMVDDEESLSKTELERLSDVRRSRNQSVSEMAVQFPVVPERRGSAPTSNDDFRSDQQQPWIRTRERALGDTPRTKQESTQQHLAGVSRPKEINRRLGQGVRNQADYDKEQNTRERMDDRSRSDDSSANTSEATGRRAARGEAPGGVERRAKGQQDNQDRPAAKVIPPDTPRRTQTPSAGVATPPKGGVSASSDIIGDAIGKNSTRDKYLSYLRGRLGKDAYLNQLDEIKRRWDEQEKPVSDEVTQTPSTEGVSASGQKDLLGQDTRTAQKVHDARQAVEDRLRGKGKQDVAQDTGGGLFGQQQKQVDIADVTTKKKEKTQAEREDSASEADKRRLKELEARKTQSLSTANELRLLRDRLDVKKPEAKVIEKPSSESRGTQPVAESHAPALSEPGNRGVTPTQTGAAPNSIENVVADLLKDDRLKNITVSISAVEAETGKAITVKHKANVLLRETQDQLELARRLLECLSL
jgi:diguanylate cyclase (GGDEF)-like protein